MNDDKPIVISKDHDCRCVEDHPLSVDQVVGAARRGRSPVMRGSLVCSRIVKISGLELGHDQTYGFLPHNHSQLIILTWELWNQFGLRFLFSSPDLGQHVHIGDIHQDTFAVHVTISWTKKKEVLPEVLVRAQKLLNTGMDTLPDDPLTFVTTADSLKLYSQNVVPHGAAPTPLDGYYEPTAIVFVGPAYAGKRLGSLERDQSYDIGSMMMDAWSHANLKYEVRARFVDWYTANATVFITIPSWGRAKMQDLLAKFGIREGWTEVSAVGHPAF